MAIRTVLIKDSAQITELKYDTELHDLTVTFKNGDKWKYHEVSKLKFAALVVADSIGSYFAKNIRPDHYGEKIVSKS